jgi:ankyrin repeat protein
VCAQLGNVPIQFAAKGGSAAVVEALLAAGAVPNVADEYSRTPLFLAAEKGHAGVVAALLKAGATVDSPRDNGQTPLHAAAYSDNTECLTLLIDAGGDVNYASGNGQVALHFVAYMGFDASCEILLRHGARTEVHDETPGNTPLHMAAISNSAGVAALLLKAGASKTAKNTARGARASVVVFVGAAVCVRC